MLARKVILRGYYWPTIKKDAKDLVSKCEACQFHANIHRKPVENTTPIGSEWSFAQWGMDILGPFPIAKAQKKFLIVAIDHFTKWIEAEAVPTITSQRVQDFFFKEIICRFGIPHTLITDNGTQFASQSFRNF